MLVGQTLPDGSVQRQTQLLVPLVCVMIGAQLLRSCVRYGMTASLEYVSQNVQQDIRRHLYDNLCTQDAGFYTRYRTGDLMTRLTGDLDMVRHTDVYKRQVRDASCFGARRWAAAQSS